MRDWNRLIVGDAFKLLSRDMNYYRDMFLLWPILAFSSAAIVHIISPEPPAYRIYGFKLAACAIVAIALAKERLILITGGAGYVAIRLAVALALTQDWRTYLVGFLVSAAIVFAALWLGKDWKSSYERPAKTSLVGLAMGVAGIGAAVAVGLWLKP
jgi:hypothetical protein